LQTVQRGAVDCDVRLMSALPPKADIAERNWDVRFVPKGDITNLARKLLVRVSCNQRNRVEFRDNALPVS
jgi:hypothetical protein